MAPAEAPDAEAMAAARLWSAQRSSRCWMFVDAGAGTRRNVPDVIIVCSQKVEAGRTEREERGEEEEEKKGMREEGKRRLWVVCGV